MGDPTPNFRTVKKVILVDDLSGHARASLAHPDAEMASFLHEYYCACDRIITGNGGTVIKFIGDACLSTFPVTEAVAAIRSAVDIARFMFGLCLERGIDLKPGSNVHIAEFVEGEFGSGASRRPDILGRGVNQVFLLGRGPGIRLSEPVYRQLPSAERTPWQKFKPPAVYRIDGTQGVLEYGGKSPAENTARW